MKLAFYGSSLLSSYWNGAATYYRGLIRALAERGHAVTFFEPRAFGRQERADIVPPPWCEVVVYEPDAAGLAAVAGRAGEHDVVIKSSGVGVLDDEIAAAVLATRGALRIFWDVDAPATLAELEQSPEHPLRAWIREVDFVLTYGGGDPVVERYRALGAKACIPIYNALDPTTHYPVEPASRFTADLGFLGNRLPDREARVDELFFRAATFLPDKTLTIGGAGWDDKPSPPNVRKLGHVGTKSHNAFNCSALAVLNVSRESMAQNGHSPATRVFEAAGAAACVISDEWEGVEAFLEPGKEILLARDGEDVARILTDLDVERMREIGATARRRILSEHTYDLRAAQVEALLAPALGREAA